MKTTWLYCSTVTAMLLATACDPSDEFEGLDEFESLDEIDDSDDITLDDEEFIDEADEADEADEEVLDPAGSNGHLVSESDPSAIGTFGYWSWGTPGNYGAPLNLGPSHDRTCFLQGVTGELESASYGVPARVSVYEDGGSWWLETKAGTQSFWGQGGHGVMGHATCIPATANRRFISWAGNSSNGSNTLYSWREDFGFTKCFLTSVSGTVGWSLSDSWVAVEPWSKWDNNGVKKEGWLLHGDLEMKQDGTSGGGAAAVCVDITFQITGDYSWQSAPGSPGVADAFTPQDDAVCGIERLYGNFGNNPGGWWEGARLYPDGSDWWGVVSAYGKGIAGSCYTDIQFPWF